MQFAQSSHKRESEENNQEEQQDNLQIWAPRPQACGLPTLLFSSDAINSCPGENNGPLSVPLPLDYLGEPNRIIPLEEWFS